MLAMDPFAESPGASNGYKDIVGVKDQRNTSIQIGLSVILGVAAFLSFCVRSLVDPMDVDFQC